MWNWIAPLIPRRQWPDLLRMAALGAVVAGCYGAAHDQVTFGISPEYFTEAKFVQFAWADLGMGPRRFAAAVGFLASWWVGAVAGWLLGRLALPRMDRCAAWSRVRRGFGVTLGGAVLGGVAGAMWGAGLVDSPALEDWRWLERELDVTDLGAFVRVACIHDGGYLGALLGFVVAAWRTIRGASNRPV